MSIAASRLDPLFLGPPIAHRGLHDRAAGLIENSRAACAAAVDCGYGIEIDVQLSADGEAMVFHDAVLDRLTGQTGPVNQRTAAELATIHLTDGGETIPTLAEILTLIDGRAALLVEIKDQTGAMADAPGLLEARSASLIAAYKGPIAAMSFNPYSMIWMRRNAPEIARGIVSYGFGDPHDGQIDADHRAALAALDHADAAAVDFVSYGAGDLPNPACDALRASGTPVFTWTIRSEAAAVQVAPHVDNITFEGYRPAL